MSEADVERMFREQSEIPSRLTAPPSGLFLQSVVYESGRALPALRPIMSIDLMPGRQPHKS
jgi:hypothetical protein